jgi:hypothetical protein
MRVGYLPEVFVTGQAPLTAKGAKNIRKVREEVQLRYCCETATGNTTLATFDGSSLNLI